MEPSQRPASLIMYDINGIWSSFCSVLCDLENIFWNLREKLVHVHPLHPQMLSAPSSAPVAQVNNSQWTGAKKKKCTDGFLTQLRGRYNSVLLSGNGSARGVGRLQLRAKKRRSSLCLASGHQVAAGRTAKHCANQWDSPSSTNQLLVQSLGEFSAERNGLVVRVDRSVRKVLFVCLFLKREIAPLEAKVGLLELRPYQTKRETSNGWAISLPPDAPPAPVSRADLGDCVPGQK